MADAPFHTVELSCFKEVLQYLHPKLKIGSATTQKNRIMNLYESESVLQIQTWSQNSSKFSFGIDIWTSPNQIPFMGITYHYIDDTWKLRSGLLDFIPFSSSHSGQAIFRIFDKTLEEKKLKTKLLAISVDNASNNDTFIGHMIKHYPSFTKDHHIRCFAHVLNLSSQAVMKADDERIIRLRDCIREFRTSPRKMLDLMEIYNSLDNGGSQFVKPILDVPTRWNSTLDMLERALKLKSCLNEFFDTKFSENDWIFFERICEFLSPFKECTLLVNAQSTVTLSLVVTLYNRLLDHVQNELEHIDEIDPMFHAFTACFQKLEHYYNVSSELCTSATLLDPRFKTSEYEDNPAQLAQVVKQVQNEFEKLYFKVDNRHFIAPPRVYSGFVANALNRKQKTVQCESATEEFERYLSLPLLNTEIDPLDWWKTNALNFPNLSKMARDYLAVPGTEASVEREFSSGRRLITNERASLKDTTIQAVQCLKSWLNSES